MKTAKIFLCVMIFSLFIFGCSPSGSQDHREDFLNASEYGLSAENTGEENSKILQNLIDMLSEKGGTVYIPSGEYEFAKNGTQLLGSHCIKMKSNVHIIGDGETTVLKPTGDSYAGLDMFYFNEYLDIGEAVYLENCRFENFVIDGSQTSCRIYTSAGKGFMFNLFRNCHWKNVTVQYTDATGFGVDCPIDSSMTDCTAIGCGKGATVESTGASGFGIGFGYCEEESIQIVGCTAEDNRKFGFFFEHQGLFSDERYGTERVEELLLRDCVSRGNLYNYGGLMARNAVYDSCVSSEAQHYGFYFENAVGTEVLNCVSRNDTLAGFAIHQTEAGGKTQFADITLSDCQCENNEYGVKIIGGDTPLAKTLSVDVLRCVFTDVSCPVYTEGMLQKLCLRENAADGKIPCFSAKIENFTDEANSWNES
ncbi:MAG: hypothetical protein IJA86_07025 [Clostridia bacterium]|nr:hypothetical protein [Clostridia bacterium]